MGSAALETLTEQNFDQKIAQGVVLIDFFAPWCGPCKMLTPILEKLKAEVSSIHVYQVDTDQSFNLASRFEITAVPTVILFKEGKLVQKVSGLKDLTFWKNLVS